MEYSGLHITLYNHSKKFYINYPFFHNDWYKDHCMHQRIKEDHQKNRYKILMDKVPLIILIVVLVIDSILGYPIYSFIISIVYHVFTLLIQLFWYY